MLLLVSKNVAYIYITIIYLEYALKDIPIDGGNKGIYRKGSDEDGSLCSHSWEQLPCPRFGLHFSFVI